MSSYNLLGDVYFVGDIHAQPRGVEYTIRSNNLTGANFIFLGDVGLGFGGNHKGPCKFLNKLAEETKNRFYIFRGNHDNPASYYEHKEELQKLFPAITVLQDFDELLLENGERGLVVAGAFSIDRIYRTEGMNWWRDELMHYDCVPQGHFDFVVAHSGITPPELRAGSAFFDSMCRKDPEAKRFIDEEQEYIGKVIDAVQPKHWYNGHFHVHSIFEHGDVPTVVHALDIDEVVLKTE